MDPTHLPTQTSYVEETEYVNTSRTRCRNSIKAVTQRKTTQNDDTLKVKGSTCDMFIELQLWSAQ